MEGLVSYTHVFQFLILSLLLSTTFGDPQIGTGNHGTLSKQV